MLFEYYPRLKKILPVAGLCLLVLLVVYWLYGLLSTATITVVGQHSTDLVSIQGVSTNSSYNNYKNQGTYSMSVRVHPGIYTAFVSDAHGDSASSKTINVKARQHVTVRLTVSALTAPEPVYGGEVNNVAADSSNLSFLDTNSGTLRRTDSQGNFSVLFNGNRFLSATWTNPLLGVGKSSYGTLFALNGDSAALLPLPQGPVSAYTIAPGGTIYAVIGSSLYSSNGSSQVEKIQSGVGGASVVTASSQGGVAILYSSGGGNTPQKNGNEKFISLLQNGHQAKVSVSNISGLTWSPNGKYLLASGPAGAELYDTSLHQISTMPTNNNGVFVWLNDTTILESNQGKLWQYGLNTGESHLLANFGNGQSIVTVSPSLSNDYVYVGVSSGNRQELYRVGLLQQDFSVSVSTLAAFMPEQLGACSLNFINFVKPVILVSFPDSSSQQSCVNAVDNELWDYDLAPSSFPVVTFLTTST